MNPNQLSNGVDDAIVVGNALDKPSNDPRHVECLNLVRNIYEQAFFQLKNATTYDEVLKIKKVVNDYLENLENISKEKALEIAKKIAGDSARIVAIPDGVSVMVRKN